MDFQQTNMAMPERVISAVSGGTLLGFGLKRGSLLGAAMTVAGGDLLLRGLTGHSVLYEILGTRTTGKDGERQAGDGHIEPEVVRSVTVRAPADDLYRQWRDPQQLSRIMGDEITVSSTGDDTLHWAVKTPIGKTVEWDALITDDEPGKRIAWQSADGAPVPNSGSVEFRQAPADRGTEIVLRLRVDPPGGPLGDTVAKVVGFAPGIMAKTALRRAKSLAETGEIPTNAGPAARWSRITAQRQPPNDSNIGSRLSVAPGPVPGRSAGHRARSYEGCGQ